MRTLSAAVRVLAACLLAAVAASAVAQQAYPARPIRIVVTYPPGGAVDIVARLLAQKLSTNQWGQPALVENRPGGNTIIGNEHVAKSAPDGYSILYVSSTTTILPSLHRRLPYDTIKDFAPLCTLIVLNYALVVNPTVPANNLKEFIALAKSKPGQLNFASVGTGGIIHLSGELFNLKAGVKIQTVPYKGSAPAVLGVMGGEVQALFGDTSVVPHIQSGKLRALAISGAARSPVMPQVPTFSEAGMPDFEASAWHGLLVPAGTPRPIIDKLAAEITRIMGLPDIKEKVASQGAQQLITTPDQFGALLKTDIANFAKVIKAANIKVEN